MLIVVAPCCFIWSIFTSYLSSSFHLTFLLPCGPCCFIWSISHLTLSSFSSQTQQPFVVLLRSTSTSASGTCQVWRWCNTVRLSLPIVDSCVPLVLYLVHFTSDFSSSFSQTKQPLIIAPFTMTTSRPYFNKKNNKTTLFMFRTPPCSHRPITKQVRRI